MLRSEVKAKKTKNKSGWARERPENEHDQTELPQFTLQLGNYIPTDLIIKVFENTRSTDKNVKNQLCFSHKYIMSYIIKKLTHFKLTWRKVNIPNLWTFRHFTTHWKKVKNWQQQTNGGPRTPLIL